MAVTAWQFPSNCPLEGTFPACGRFPRRQDFVFISQEGLYPKASRSFLRSDVIVHGGLLPLS